MVREHAVVMLADIDGPGRGQPIGQGGGTYRAAILAIADREKEAPLTMRSATVRS